MSTPQDPEEQDSERSASAPAPAPSQRAERAAALAAQGQLTQALDAYTQAAAEHPADVGVLLGLGHTLVQLGRYDAAERELRRALRLAPDQPEVRLQLGVTLHKRGNYTAAVSELRRTTELEPSAAGYLVLGEALNQMAEPDAAIEALEHAARLQPDNGRAFYAMGIAYDRKGQFDRAAEMYRLSREAGARAAASADAAT
jgi:Flp pilus assembly protein TadD